MSHFTVLVIGEDPEAQLAPFQENNMGDCPKEYLEFNDVEAESWEEYNNPEETSACVVGIEFGDIHSKYDDAFQHEKEGQGDRPAFIRDTEFRLPEGYELVDIPHNKRYATFDEFMQDWHGWSGRDEKMGKYGYWENPNRKWDWYVLGGRWKGFFKLLPPEQSVVPMLTDGASDGTETIDIEFKERQAVRGEPGVFDNEARGPDWVDQVRKQDIDFEGMMAVAEQEAIERFDKFEAAVEGVEYTPVPWEQIRELYDDVEDAREFYRNLPLTKATRELTWEDPVETFCLLEENPRQTYIDSARKSAFTPFAVVKDGQWYERGEMGWWAIVSDEKDRNEWRTKVYELIAGSPDNTLFSLYDCHI